MGRDDRSDGRQGPTERGAIARWAALVRFALARVGYRIRRTASRQLVATVVIVAVAIALSIAVTGISMELAERDRVATDADLRVVPDGGGSLSSVIAVEAPRLGDTHSRTERIDRRDDVIHSTPVFVDVVQLRPAGAGEPTSVLAVGVVPGPESPPVFGMPTDGLEGGDPYYADGSYDGDYTGDVLLSVGAAEQLNAEAGDEVALRSGAGGAPVDAHEVTGVESSNQAGDEQLPVAVFRLSELQTAMDATDADLADQVVVRTDDRDAVRPVLESVYPDATVVESGSESAADELRSDELALALSATATIIGVGVCVLVVATTMGLVVEGDRRTLAVLAALGFPSRARLGLIGVTVIALTALGAVLGLLLGTLTVFAVNGIVRTAVTGESIATIGTWAVPYAAGVAFVAGVLAAPYPLTLAGRADVVDELGRE